MKWLRPRSADSGLVTVLLVSEAELGALIDALGRSIPPNESTEGNLARRKLRAGLRTARGN